MGTETEITNDAETTTISAGADIGLDLRLAATTGAGGQVCNAVGQDENCAPPDPAGICSETDLGSVEVFTDVVSSGSGATGQGFISASVADGVATGFNCSDNASGSTAHRLDCTTDTLPAFAPAPGPGAIAR